MNNNGEFDWKKCDFINFTHTTQNTYLQKQLANRPIYVVANTIITHRPSSQTTAHKLHDTQIIGKQSNKIGRNEFSKQTLVYEIRPKARVPLFHHPTYQHFQILFYYKPIKLNIEQRKYNKLVTFLKTEQCANAGVRESIHFSLFSHHCSNLIYIHDSCFYYY